jgi:glycosyltransferase involved in cell wall biosynthesis
MRLAIISHTPHYKDGDRVVGWSATTREVDHLTDIFETIYHLAPLHSGDAPGSAQAYSSNRVEYIPLKPFGGSGIKAKISILSTSAYNLRQIKSIIKSVDWIQFRAPTSMGLYVIPYLSLMRNRNKWVKYAGNWEQKKAPMSYKLQRWWLKNNLQGSKVTINGIWDDQEHHLISFENPCLSIEERKDGRRILEGKDYSCPLNFLFVGRIEEEKGVGRIIKALQTLKNKEWIGEVNFIGGGDGIDKFIHEAAATDLQINFLGEMPREEINKYYKKSHILLLPSTASEGFPKVIAEGCNYGLVPLVSNVSSIPHYIKNGMNGFVWKIEDGDFDQFVSQLDFSASTLRRLSENAFGFADAFTYDAYNRKILNTIIRS